MKSVREKLYGGVSRLSWLLGCALIASGCSDEDLSGVDGSESTSGNGIYFGIVDSASGWGDEADARASMSSEDVHEAEVFVLRGATSSDTLRVGVTVTDGIVVSDNKCASVQSRGVPVEQATDLLNFGVTAFYYPSESSSQPTAYYMKNEQVTRGNGIYSTSDTYYWPSAGQLNFVAVAPYCEALAVGDDYKVSFSYTPDKDASKHEDLMLSNTGKKLNNNTSGTAVGLSFEHLLTAVQFKIGGTPTGAVKSISLSGEMVASGTYTVGSGWTYGDATPDAEYVIGYAEDHSTGLVKDQMLLLPQTIGKDKVTLTVVFDDKDSGKERTLSAKIPAIEWVASKTTTYVINITPEYTLEFASTPEYVDAHYVMVPITINVSNYKGLSGGWVVKSEQDWVKLRKNKVGLEYDGFWIDPDGTYTNDGKVYTVNEKYARSLTYSEEPSADGNVTIWAFFEENVSGQERMAKFSLYPIGHEDKVVEANVIQHTPYIVNGVQWECIEEDDNSYPWGFNWNFSEVYTVTGAWLSPSAKAWIYRWLIFDSSFLKALFGIPDDAGYLKKGSNDVIATIDYSQIQFDENFTNTENDGLANTREIYNYKGSASLESIRNYLNNISGVTCTVDPSNASVEQAKDYAVKKIVDSKNKFVAAESKDSENNIIESAIINESDIVWYLPAKNEYSELEKYSLDGNSYYWTSSFYVGDNTTAYGYSKSGISLMGRAEVCRLRAARAK